MSEQPLLKVENLKKHFPIKKGVFKKVVGHVKAVDDISFSLTEGETLGLVGESGCGKSTTGKMIMQLVKPTAGSIQFFTDGHWIELNNLKGRELKEVRKNIQMVFQDPHASLDSRMTVRDIVAEPFMIHKIGNRKRQTEQVGSLLEKVGLRTEHMSRYPNEFSGGQRQRIGIARALALNPRLIICDEPVSALDVSVQAQVLNLLADLQEELGLTYLFIAHDLNVVEHVSDRIMVMYLGKIVEIAKAPILYESPGHPYTEALLNSIPVADPLSKRKRKPLQGTVPNPADPPSGCYFHTRCPYAQELCRLEEPSLTDQDGQEHYVACHFAQELQLAGFTQTLEREV